MPTWLRHKDKKIIYLDLRELTEDEMIDKVRAFKTIVLDLGKNGVDDILFMVNTEGQYALRRVFNEILDTARSTNKFIRKGAIVGELNSTKRILMTAYLKVTGGKRKPMPDEESAKDWLVEP